VTGRAAEARALPTGGYVGRSVRRKEDPRLLLGRAIFTDDIHLPGMLHVAFLRSPWPHATITSIDATAAEALEGVIGVFTSDDLAPVLGTYSTTFAREEVASFTRRPLESSKAYYVGQPLAVVVATSRYIAEDAVDEIVMNADVLPVVMDPAAALADDAPLIWPDLGTNNYAHIEYERGDVEAIFEKADHVFSKRLVHGRHMAAPLENRAIVADYEVSTEELTMWVSTQMPHMLRSELAGPLGIPESRIRVVGPSVGGGFGMKCVVFDEDAIVPAVSRLLGRPMKWTEDRYENLAASAHAKDQICDIEIAVSADGTFEAFRGNFIGVSGAWPAHPWTSLVDPLCAGALLPGLYDIKAVAYTADSPLTNRCPIGPYRGIGWTAGHSTMQVLVDEAANALGMDPVQLRLKNMIPDEPFVSVTGMRYDGGSYQASVRKVLEMLDYEQLRERQAEMRSQGRYLGIGISPYIEPTAWGSQLSHIQGFPWEFFDSGDVTVEPDGSVTVTTGLHSHGQSHATTFAQVAADVVGVRLEDVKVVQGDTATSAMGNGTYASRSAVIGSGMIMRAGGEVREKMVRLAAHAMEVSPDDIELTEGEATVRGAPFKKMTVPEIAQLAYYGGDSRPDDLEPGLTATRAYDPPETYSNGTFAAVVEVDAETGHVTIEEIVCCEDCGRMLNPMVVDGQVHGAVAQGIGGALYEHVLYDEAGQLQTGTLVDYLYPSSAEVPPMRISHIETPSIVTEGGIKGTGECGTIAAGPAVLSAIADALRPFGNIEITKTPLRPMDVLDLIDAARAPSVDVDGR
jgi:carbon-monoxide dehydrogenase large subunit